jgi:hypothetical protein
MKKRETLADTSPGSRCRNSLSVRVSCATVVYDVDDPDALTPHHQLAVSDLAVAMRSGRIGRLFENHFVKLFDHLRESRAAPILIELPTL